MLIGTVIDNMVIGGPAYNSDRLEKGDTIVQVNGKPVSAEELPDMLIGDDIPGTSVVITVQRGEEQFNLSLTRMATETIADRRRMFELFTTLKVDYIICQYNIICRDSNFF